MLLWPLSKPKGLFSLLTGKKKQTAEN